MARESCAPSRRLTIDEFKELARNPGRRFRSSS